MIDKISSATDDYLPEKPSLKSGLLALRKKDYLQAIAILEIIAQQESIQEKLKAQMVLVIAYEKTKQVDKSISLCRNLTQSSDSKIKIFANRHLKELLKRYPPKNFKKSTFPESTNLEKSPQNQQNIETGFIPFNSISDQHKFAKNSNNISKKNIDLFLETDSQQISKTTNNFPENYSKTSDYVQHSQLNKNDIEAVQNQSPALSSIVNQSNSKTTNEFHQTSIEKTSDKPENSPILTWREAGRTKGGRRLKTPNLTFLWLEQIVVFIVLFFLSLTILKFSLDVINDLLVWLPYFRPIQIFYRDPTKSFIIFIAVLFVFFPWLIDGLLSLGYKSKFLPKTTLMNYSKEANRLLRSFSQKQKIREIKLKVLPIDVPIAFSYGWFLRCFRLRIVVSQGLLDKLAEDEIATIYAREISHVKNGTLWLMSMANLMLQIPYTIYWKLTFWADWIWDLIIYQLPDFLPGFIKYFLRVLVVVLRIFAAIISSISYGLYWLLKFPILWFSRRRVYYSDRLACNLTGNPNGLTRAILKITIGMANDVENQGKVRNLLESFEILMPVAIKQAITAGSVVSDSSLVSTFNWDIVNPYRRWLEINNSHPMLGDRLKRLGSYANLWKLETELNLGNINTDVTMKNQLSGTKENQISIPQNLDWQKLLLQGAPFFGILIGLGFAIFLWLIGIVSSAIGFWRLDWLFGDISILVSCLAMGFSIGILIRINRFFPDVKLTKLLLNPDLSELLSDLKALPLDSQTIQLKGQLLGKSGMSNWLGQDLILQTTRGLVKLHYSNQLGPLGNLWPKINRPADFVGKSITVTGWWRRGATPWIDINTLKTENGQFINSGHPLWSTIVAFSFAIWGAYMVLIGGF